MGIESDVQWLLERAAAQLVGARVLVRRLHWWQREGPEGEGLVIGSSGASVEVRRDDGTTFTARVSEAEPAGEGG